VLTASGNGRDGTRQPFKLRSDENLNAQYESGASRKGFRDLFRVGHYLACVGLFGLAAYANLRTEEIGV
jgi:hypothetical protein